MGNEGFTGSITQNRQSVPMSPAVRQAFFDEAKELSIRPTELMRNHMTEFYWDRQRRLAGMSKPKAQAPEDPAREDALRPLYRDKT